MYSQLQNLTTLHCVNQQPDTDDPEISKPLLYVSIYKNVIQILDNVKERIVQKHTFQ